MDSEYLITRQQMASGSGEAEKCTYSLMAGSDGRRWLVADQENAADNIYVEGSPDDRPKGFAGRTLTFPLSSRGEVKLIGPWHTNAEALFTATGYDIRERHRTYVVVAKRREYENYQTYYRDILYQDEEPRIGSFDRGKVIAQEWADKLGETVYCYSESQGGSSDSPINTRKENHHEGGSNG